MQNIPVHQRYLLCICQSIIIVDQIENKTPFCFRKTCFLLIFRKVIELVFSCISVVLLSLRTMTANFQWSVSEIVSYRAETYRKFLKQVNKHTVCSILKKNHAKWKWTALEAMYIFYSEEDPIFISPTISNYFINEQNHFSILFFF